MKIEIFKTVAKKVKINFPISFKNGNRYYHFWTEKSGIRVWKSSSYEEIQILTRFEGFENETIICEKSEVDGVFCEIRDKSTATLFPVDATAFHLTPDEMTKPQLVNEILSQGNGNSKI